MPVLGFRPDFVPKVENGTKRQTIRPERADKRPHVKVGELVDLVAGNRTPQRRVIGIALVVDYTPVYLRFGPARLLATGDPANPSIQSGHLHLDMFARADGFKNWADLESWFAKTHDAEDDFGGWLIRWEPQWALQAVTYQPAREMGHRRPAGDRPRQPRKDRA